VSWIVRVHAAGDGKVPAQAAEAMADELARYGAELEVRDGRYTAVFDLSGDLPNHSPRALSRPLAAFRSAAERAGMPSWPIVAAEAITKAEDRRRARTSPGAGLVGVAEVAEMLGVTRQRVGQLRGRLPEPLATLRAGPVWERSAIEEFETAWVRSPGRPRKAG